MVNQAFSAEMMHIFANSRRLPGCLADTGDLALVCQLTEADTADAVIAQIGVGSSADFASVIVAAGELGRLLLLQNHRFFCHLYFSSNQA